MDVHFSTVALGVDDVDRALNFYGEAFGLEVQARYGQLVYLATGSTRLALYPRTALAAYAGVEPAPTDAGVLLSLNLDSRTAVDRSLRGAIEAGAVLSRPAGRFDWGGYGGCVRDPDGHLWELVHAPPPTDSVDPSDGAS